jgi:peptidyl-prolyl cis-trans isomerase B (cyclophilin B)
MAARIAEGILRYRTGEFDAAAAILQPIVDRYPADEELRHKAKSSLRYRDAWGQELGFRKADEAKGDLPRVRLETTKGPIVLELFEDDAKNTVANFVFLVRKGFYAGTKFHRNVPFFVVQGGDPLSKSDDPRAGQGGPGYAIRTEPSRRRPFRGVVAMARGARPDTEGSQFFLVTGTAAHLDGEYSVFGRILEGQDVSERLVAGDAIARAEVVRARDHEYRPTTVAGALAPEPR